MLTIRKDQIKILDNYIQKQFIIKMVTFIESNFHEELVKFSPQELSALIQEGINRASEFGIVWEDDIQRFLECMFIYGHDFGKNQKIKWAYKILREEGLTGTQKMDRIDSYSIFIMGGK